MKRKTRTLYRISVTHPAKDAKAFLERDIIRACSKADRYERKGYTAVIRDMDTGKEY